MSTSSAHPLPRFRIGERLRFGASPIASRFSCSAWRLSAVVNWSRTRAGCAVLAKAAIALPLAVDVGASAVPHSSCSSHQRVSSAGSATPSSLAIEAHASKHELPIGIASRSSLRILPRAMSKTVRISLAVGLASASAVSSNGNIVHIAERRSGNGSERTLGSSSQRVARQEPLTLAIPP